MAKCIARVCPIIAGTALSRRQADWWGIFDTFTKNGERKMIRSLIPSVALLALLSFGMSLPGEARAAYADGGTAIAFVRTTATDGDQIWLVAPDGSGAHPIYTPGTSAQYPQADIGALSWKPDATELAFSSDHESTCSVWQYALYSIRPNGSGYRRITNGPACADFARYPKGSVNIEVDNASTTDVVVYFEGDPHIKFASPGYNVLSFNDVADLGNVSQSAVAMLSLEERTPATAGVDVTAGATAHVPGPLDIGTQGYTSLSAYWPSWSGSGDRLSFVFGAATPRAVAANPSPLARGNSLLAPGGGLAGIVTDLAWSPNPAKGNQFLYRSLDLDQLPYNHIYRFSEGSSGPGDMLVTPSSDGQDYLGLAWLPDASGFVYSQLDPGVWGATDHANIYRYDFAAAQSVQLTDFPANDYAGRLSVGPGGRIVFERTTTKDRSAQIDLWVMDADGGNMRLLAQDAHSPAWSPRPLPVYHSTYLPLLKR
jgi:hypothetical protein